MGEGGRREKEGARDESEEGWEARGMSGERDERGHGRRRG